MKTTSQLGVSNSNNQNNTADNNNCNTFTSNGHIDNILFMDGFSTSTVVWLND